MQANLGIGFDRSARSAIAFSVRIALRVFHGRSGTPSPCAERGVDARSGDG